MSDILNLFNYDKETIKHKNNKRHASHINCFTYYNQNECFWEVQISLYDQKIRPILIFFTAPMLFDQYILCNHCKLEVVCTGSWKLIKKSTY